MSNTTTPTTTIKNNDELFTQKFISANEKLRVLLPELHDAILGLSPFTNNQIQISNAWTNFKQMDFWISVVMKEAFEKMTIQKETKTTITDTEKK